jgi:hypothetical protein
VPWPSTLRVFTFAHAVAKRFCYAVSVIVARFTVARSVQKLPERMPKVRRPGATKTAAAVALHMLHAPEIGANVSVNALLSVPLRMRVHKK